MKPRPIEGLLFVVIILLAILLCVAGIKIVNSNQQINKLEADAANQEARINELLKVIKEKDLQIESLQKQVEELNAQLQSKAQQEQALAEAAERGRQMAQDFIAQTEVSTAATDHQYQTVRDAWINEVWVPQEDVRQRVWRYVQAMGLPVTMEDVRYCCGLAFQGGYDPRIWAIIAMGENKIPPNIYGFGGGKNWEIPSGGYQEQTAWLHNRITTFYSQSVDISKPEQILWFHHEGEALNGRDPFSVFYVRNVYSWLSGI